MENNKTMILSILGVLVLVIAVVGVSFAMYSFSATGTKENVITTGSVSLSISKQGTSLFNLTNAYGISDKDGLDGNTGSATGDFTLTANLSGTMNIHYEVGFVELTTGNTNLTDSMVKLAIKDGANNYYTGNGVTTTDATAISLNSLAGSYGFASNDTGMTGKDASTYLLNSYVFDKGIITQNGQVKTYTITAWIDETYTLKGGEENTANVTTGSCSVADKNTEAECTEANGVWTNTQTKATTQETFSFKVKVQAAQY